jgi:ferrochelatase
MSKKGVLLINLGTPDNSDPASVRRYLKEFLNDPRVIDLPNYIRWGLVNLIILPLRYKKSALAYKQIWQPAGSPLLVNSRRLTAALSTKLGTDYQVELGMRYGNPSIPTALNALQHCDSLQLLPLFPQYSAAATGSAIEKSLYHLTQQWNIPTLVSQKDFYQHPGFITAYANMIKNSIHDQAVDLLLFSYHGLPERHINKSDCQATCNHLDACPLIKESNLYCYRAQCYTTSRLLAEQLKITPDQYQVSFQSRLGQIPWIKPYTDKLLSILRQKGVNNIAVACPSFVVDCLETLEEINIRARKQWTSLGGNQFTFIPCLNDSTLWVQTLAEMLCPSLTNCS